MHCIHTAPLQCHCRGHRHQCAAYTTCLCSATAVAIAASLSSGATAVSGAGTLALNRITGSAQAYAQWAEIVTVTAEDPAAELLAR